MAKTMIVTLPSGNKVLFGAPPKGGLHEVSAKDKLIETSGSTFEKALGSLGELVAVLEKSVGALEKRPSKIEMEFGATLSGECDLWIVSGHGEAEFKVTLSWEADGKPGSA
jgi:Trypsin-co-occurring domain 1